MLHWARRSGGREDEDGEDKSDNVRCLELCMLVNTSSMSRASCKTRIDDIGIFMIVISSLFGNRLPPNATFLNASTVPTNPYTPESLNSIPESSHYSLLKKLRRKSCSTDMSISKLTSSFQTPPSSTCLCSVWCSCLSALCWGCGF